MNQIDEGVLAFAKAVDTELRSARRKFPPIQGAHACYSIILEEVDEFWDIVKKKPSDRDPQRMYEELVQISAMAQRAAEDLGVVPEWEPVFDVSNYVDVCSIRTSDEDAESGAFITVNLEIGEMETAAQYVKAIKDKLVQLKVRALRSIGYDGRGLCAEVIV